MNISPGEHAQAACVLRSLPVEQSEKIETKVVIALIWPRHAPVLERAVLGLVR